MNAQQVNETNAQPVDVVAESSQEIPDNSSDPRGLLARGMRFYIRDDDALWLHPLDLKGHEIDTTGMSDDEFAELYVLERDKFRSRTARARVGHPTWRGVP
ncbi:MAG: hypothetical protein WKF61_00665 [Luteimonas sp.]